MTEENPPVNTTASPEAVGEVLRDENGRILPGSPPLNPDGKGGPLKGRQPYSQRLAHYGDMSFAELDALAANATEMHKRNAFERAAIFQALAIADKDHPRHHTERELGNDRIEGKAAQHHKVGGDGDNPSPIKLDGTFTLVFGTDGNDSDEAPTPPG